MPDRKGASALLIRDGIDMVLESRGTGRYSGLPADLYTYGQYPIYLPLHCILANSLAAFWASN